MCLRRLRNQRQSPRQRVELRSASGSEVGNSFMQAAVYMAVSVNWDPFQGV